jgi:hypothetical protein
VHADRFLRVRVGELQRDWESVAGGVDQHHELRVPPLLALLVAECGVPEPDGTPHVPHVDHDRGEMQVADHFFRVWHAGDPTLLRWSVSGCIGDH